MILSIFLLLVGLGILIVGGESLVRGASSIAKRLKVAPIVIGLTIVAFGTSAPELAVNLFSAFQGSTDIAIGNIIGSNIANILLILGICAMMRTIRVQKNTVWKEIPLALLAVLLVFVMAHDRILDGGTTDALTRTDGLALMGIFAIFLYYTFGIAKVSGEADKDEVKLYSTPISTLLIIGGLAGLVFGGKILVDNAIVLAQLAGMSEALIGLTIVAVGTSLPELVTSIIAVRHGQDDLAVGNIVGSNIFNILWILGLTASILPLPISPAGQIDVLVNIGATLLLFFFMFIGTKHRLNRWQGLMFVLIYVGYVGYLVMRG
ncbi:MAG TPA: calcium/sodium antiporter [Candidatus Magasanikbacteria bacterium]|nr:calcium/sodium antiporter [Candidatus Magasanikbacteria bacterium]